MTKTTKRENFTTIANILATTNHPELEEVMLHEIELLDKKKASASSKPSIKQAENAEIKKAIASTLLSGKWYRCAEIKAMIPALAEGEGTQRTARLCNDLEKEGVLVKTVEKRVVYFALAE